MKRLTAIYLTTTLSALLLAGCGGGGPINSGVDSSKPASELSDDEIEQVCEATVDYIEQQDLHDASCRGQGLAAAIGAVIVGGGDDEMQDACEVAYDACIDAGPEEADCNPDSVAVDDCDSTVGEIETCMADSIDEYATTADQIPSCSELTVDSLEDLDDMAEPPEEPESCESLDDTCPNFFASDAD